MGLPEDERQPRGAERGLRMPCLQGSGVGSLPAPQANADTRRAAAGAATVVAARARQNEKLASVAEVRAPQARMQRLHRQPHVRLQNRLPPGMSCVLIPSSSTSQARKHAEWLNATIEPWHHLQLQRSTDRPRFLPCIMHVRLTQPQQIQPPIIQNQQRCSQVRHCQADHLPHRLQLGLVQTQNQLVQAVWRHSQGKHTRPTNNRDAHRNPYPHLVPWWARRGFHSGCPRQTQVASRPCSEH
jgi:hypothetical protein